MENLILSVNEDNYESFIEVSSKKELVEKMYSYLLENGFEDKDEFEKETVEEWVNWEGVGTYVLSGRSFECPGIERVENILDAESPNLNFPFSILAETFEDTDKWVEGIKKDKESKYIYLIGNTRHTSTPAQYNLSHIMYSNEEIDDPIEYLNDEHGMFVGEFDTLGANCFAQDISEIDVDELYKYSCDNFTEVYVK